MNPELARLRAEAIKKRAAATAKIGRLRKQGVQVVGSKFDVRRPAENVSRYNAAQLKSYLGELSEFTDRRTKFIAGAAGAPIPVHQWEAYMGLQTQFNIRVERHEKAVSGIKLHKGDDTVSERETIFAGKRHKTAQGDILNRPMYKIEREAFRIAGADALEALTKDMRNRVKRGFLNKVNKKTEHSFSMILKSLGDTGAVEKLHLLSPAQKDLLFNYSPFASSLLQTYGFKNMDEDGKYSATVDNNMEEINEILDWAASTPKAR